MTIQIRTLKSRAEIRERIQVLGKQISDFYWESCIDYLTVIPVLDGASVFCADLLREIRFPMAIKVEPVRIKSYQGTQSGALTAGSIPDVSFQHVLVLEDILDSGKTFDFLLPKLRAFPTRSLHSCVFLDKGKSGHSVSYRAFDISPDAFVVGYGLDYEGYYRNLPDLCEVR